ncbi:glycoside hydrolase family 2 TIM barrel-domain containing protein [Robiginitalea sp. M366]|uniref:glycoside hydrolase family 2 protein n=1 Tax=Robiginitalea aestuariiviva TaxID=3036903 RepID=UPI00240E30A7|nr:sugar-binding domain-containing protein [Robiginitalea aestuariiviva]MDG1572019.1 glycoside hydrolase family 2 TIM barrel-domain containing protein [Robiginitalea aestuariiviva]
MRRVLIRLLLICWGGLVAGYGQDIPLPEHPRPDFRRPDWINLNGAWEFRFDPSAEGMKAGWERPGVPFDRSIQVPFPWGSSLSGVPDEADIGWYRRQIVIPEAWKGKRVFLVIGASDWQTDAWLNGTPLGSHQGGYVPIEFELTGSMAPGTTQELVIRADDARRDFTLYGKQGYGNARGIWQTVYLEARGPSYLSALHLTPDTDREVVTATAYLDAPAARPVPLTVTVHRQSGPVSRDTLVPAGTEKVHLEIPMENPQLWDLENPHLYEVSASLGSDKVASYFGMRKISVVNLPGTDYPYIALNGKPVYLQLALDQSYHPEGFYTFPTDAFMREEIERSKAIGLNGIRVHIKVEVPRKLYWADKLGLLVMSDLPNSWGAPDADMQRESETTLRRMIRRDYNHPSVFSWIVFNETWGLTRNGSYTRETQNWVASMYYLAKSLDTTRLVEDNSICCGRGHTETDINSWHAYLPGYQWESLLAQISDSTYAGSPHHFEKGFLQGSQPNINSECGNVWGYQGSTGDVDWSWDYHKMMNAFRMYPKIAGWLYTEHHDVINEWNGYWRFDRSEKYTGVEQLVPGMTLKDWHSEVYLSNGSEISREVTGGSTQQVPMHLSVMTGAALGESLEIYYRYTTTDVLGALQPGPEGRIMVPYSPWMQQTLAPLQIQIPDMEGLGLLAFEVRRAGGEVLHRNFVHFVVSGRNPGHKYTRIAARPLEYTQSQWSGKQWDVLEGKKLNGAGSGYFEYTFSLPEGFNPDQADQAYFLAELGAKELFVKDRESYESDQDFMKGSRVAPSGNPNAYPMTDTVYYPSEIQVSIQDGPATVVVLPDDPADHRGVLSWHFQLRDGKLREAGSYG